MKKYILALFLSPLVLCAQDYFQQKVDYTIEVSLNDTAHELDGFIAIKYTNQSPDTLTCIYLHLWPNAYANQSTPFAKQQLENGNTDFWFSKPAQRGYIDQLDFKLNAETCSWSYDSTSQELAKVQLNHPLKPGETVQITSPFHVKIPESFSRLGHVGQSYQITQWYPKPAVYDRFGWHTMPYLDQGEFYSEYGSFDVAITLPENYVVGATGDLQDSAEIRWLNQRAAETSKINDFDPDMRFPASSSHTKTLHYHQDNIHDFAWFADKRFWVLKGEVELPHSKNKVTTWSLFTPANADLWTQAPKYLHDALYYYSLWVGDYPYRQVTAVDGTISAGGGMEYPNITVIGETKSAFELDNVITHEVGHNWFYGVLGSNERDHAWMDEGINSYYEYRYLQTKYPNRKMVANLPGGIARFLDLAQYKHRYLMDLAYQFMARENEDQAVDNPSPVFTDINYGAMVYGKSMLLFTYLEKYLGTDRFDRMMKTYFDTWKYRHPYPTDLQKIAERESGKNLSWFFDDLLTTTRKIDYKIVRVKTSEAGTGEVLLRNKGAVASPVSVSVLHRDSVLRTVWVDGFAHEKTITLPTEGGDRVQIDPLLQIPEINRKNNTYKWKKLAPKVERLRLQLFTSVEDQNRTQICWSPYVAWNNYDKTQVGLMFYNPIVPKQKFTYLLAPAFGTGSVQFIGMGKLAYHIYPDSRLQHLSVGLSGKRFSYLLFPQSLVFNKLEPNMQIDFKKKTMRSPVSQSLHLRSVIAWLEWINFDSKQKEMQRYYVNEAKYRIERRTRLNPMSMSATVQQGSNFLGLWAEANFTISYKRRNEGFFIRVFTGGFPLYLKDPSDILAPLPRLYLSTVSNSNFAYWLQKDYMFDEDFIDRNGRDKYLGRQVALVGGAFRSITTFGATSKFLATANFSTTTYRFIPIYPFASLGAVMTQGKKVEFAAEVGLSLAIIRNMVEIHLPLFTTKNIAANQKVLGLNKWYQKFSFTLKLTMQKPIDIVRRFLER